MYGFRPARNRKHPGDPPPKWAPIGRLGRISILLTVVAGVVIALLVIGTRPADALDGTPDAPTPEPPPWFGGRVEMPEHGFALTVPDGWVAMDPAGDVSAQFDVALGRLGGNSVGDHSVFPPLVTSPEFKLSLNAGPSQTPGSQLCRVWSWSPSPAESAIEMARRDAAAGDGDVLDVRDIETPHATATVIDSTLGAGHKTEYYFARQDEVLGLHCLGVPRPHDDWLSIAETFEFLPTEE